MAAYFHGNTEMQGSADGLQTLILMNPPYVAYSDYNHHPSNFIFLNSGSSVSHSQIHGIPTQTAADSYRGDVSELSGALQLTNNGLTLSLSQKQEEEVNIGLLSCKYLKAAQALLDEVVYIGKEAKNGSQSAKEDNGQHNTTAERGAGLTKQEIQIKKAKLLNMLDEVEQRYKQYQQQMQMVITWLEQAAGEGSAKTYTALALQTISKQFRCLKDAILAQIRNIGQEESLGGKMEGSRLRNIGSQQGMIHNAWRPQRGLPERSVSVLRAWLLENFLHPYPKDADKIMLAKQTGLTRSQVSNWFINARVRLWKPMVEEMYAEELKGQGSKMEATETEINNNNPRSSEATARSINAGTESVPEMESRSPKKLSMDVENQHNIAMDFFASCPIQFHPPYSGNAVSLTLGLQHCENLACQPNHASHLLTP